MLKYIQCNDNIKTIFGKGFLRYQTGAKVCLLVSLKVLKVALQRPLQLN